MMIWYSSSYSKQEFRKGRRGSRRIADEKEDRISNLPDDLLHKILSYLDLTDALQTSQLSTRWAKVPKSVPRIRFCDDKFRTYADFSRFISDFLSSSRTSFWEVSTIEFLYEFYNESARRLVPNLLNYCTSHNTKVLEVQCCFRKNKETSTSARWPPLSNINSPFMEKLTLKNNWGVFNDPNFCWILPALATLEFVNVKFEGNQCVDLLSQFCNLKNLRLKECWFTQLDVFSINSCGLVSLVVENFFIGAIGDCKFVVSAPKLVYFACSGVNFPLLHSTNDLGCVENVKVDYYYVHGETVPMVLDGEKLLNLFSHVANAVCLELSTGVLELLFAVPELLRRQPSPFNDLKQLVVARRYTGLFEDTLNKIINYFREGSPSVIVTDAF